MQQRMSSLISKHVFQRWAVAALLLGCAAILSGSASGMSVQHQVTLSPDSFTAGRVSDFDFLHSPDGVYLTDRGFPMLPVVELKVALPAGMKAETVSIESPSWTLLPGSFRILPSQPRLRIGQSPDDRVFVPANPDVYSSNSAYPTEHAALLGMTDLAGQGIAAIEICPFAYRPQSGQLELMTDFDVVVSGSDGYVCGDYLPQSLPDQQRDQYMSMVKSMVANPSEVGLAASEGSLKIQILPPGMFDEVIITSAALAGYFQPLADWRTRRGIHDTVITTTWIYANYSGTDNAQKIRNFIIDAQGS